MQDYTLQLNTLLSVMLHHVFSLVLGRLTIVMVHELLPVWLLPKAAALCAGERHGAGAS